MKSEAATTQIEPLICDRCGAEETPDNAVEFREIGRGGYSAFINEGPPEVFTECAKCAADDSEVIW